MSDDRPLSNHDGMHRQSGYDAILMNLVIADPDDMSARAHNDYLLALGSGGMWQGRTTREWLNESRRLDADDRP